MKIVIDTKEDTHILGHIIRMLHAISGQGKTRSYDSSSSLFDEVSSSSSPSSNAAAETPGLFNMFSDPSTVSSSSPSSSPGLIPDIPNIFEKKEDDKKDLFDHLQTY